MNGFQKDVAGRMLSVISHVEVFSPDGQALPDPARFQSEGRGSMPPLARPASDLEVKVRKPSGGHAGHH